MADARESGPEATRRFRAQETAKRTPIVAMTPMRWKATGRPVSPQAWTTTCPNRSGPSTCSRCSSRHAPCARLTPGSIMRRRWPGGSRNTGSRRPAVHRQLPPRIIALRNAMAGGRSGHAPAYAHRSRQQRHLRRYPHGPGSARDRAVRSGPRHRPRHRCLDRDTGEDSSVCDRLLDLWSIDAGVGGAPTG